MAIALTGRLHINKDIRQAFGIFIALMFFSLTALAEIDVSIRVQNSLKAQSDQVTYIAYLSDCSNLLSIDISAGDASYVFSPSDSNPVTNAPLACEYTFNATGAGRFNPALDLGFRDQTQQKYSRAFQLDAIAPDISFAPIAINNVAGKQALFITLNTNSADINSFAFSVLGLRASDLRKFGGVIEQIKEKGLAFADTEGVKNIFPVRSNQNQFTLVLPLQSALDAASIATDGLVLVDVVAFDASGNRTSASKLSLTGSDLVEAVSELAVSPTNIEFSDQLQTLKIIPSVNYQFRGLTPLPGAGSGVNYVSSHPQLISVSADGVVLPLANTAAESVFITVSFAGLTSINIPVKADFSRNLSALQVISGLNSNGNFALSQLNTQVQLPALEALFDDNSAGGLPQQVALEYVIPAGFEGLISLDQQGRIIAHSVITAAAPALITVRLKDTPAVQVTIPVIAFDSLPSIKLLTPEAANVGKVLSISASANDDVGIKQVDIYLNTRLLVSKTSPPYETSLLVSEAMLNQPMIFSATATDTAGQINRTADQSVLITEGNASRLPDTGLLEQPLEMQRFVESSLLQYKLAVKLADKQLDSGISYVDFYYDGKLVAQSYFGVIEQRKEKISAIKSRNINYQIWQARFQLSEISTDETSASVYSVIHDKSGNSKQVPSKLIRIVKNQPPEVVITQPVEGAKSVPGQTLNIGLTMFDDTLDRGLQLELMVDGRKVDSFFYTASIQQAEQAGSLLLSDASYRFQLPIKQQQLGRTLSIEIIATDIQGLKGSSGPLRISVQADQPPSVALSYPQEGNQFVAGLPIELRADAVDDLAVKRVDFYAAGRLVGSDTRRPYSVTYQPVAVVDTAQSLTFYALAVDSEDKTARSADVNITLGKDEQPPVVNISSPQVTQTSAGDDIALVIEDSEIVVKITGFDNVGVDTLALRGIKNISGQLTLTGDLTDTIPASQLPPQIIPGALHAFSALKLVKVALFSNAQGLSYDSYPVQAVATDKAGNQSLTKITIGVTSDQGPQIKDARLERDIYYPLDTVNIFVQASDDRGVSEMQARFYIDNATTPAITRIQNQSTGLVAAENLQAIFKLELAKLNLTANHTIRVDLIAIDDSGQKSNANTPLYSTVINVQADTNAPLVGINNPVPGQRCIMETVFSLTGKQ